MVIGSHLNDILLLLLISIVVVIVMHKMKLSPVLGYLLIGAFIGQHSLDMISDYKYIEILGELGVVFLLFVIGLELSFERLVQMRLHVFGFGMLQLIFTATIFTFLISKTFKFDIPISIILSTTLALSSTAIIMQSLTDLKRKSTQVGRLSISVLLMQDLAVVPLLALAHMLLNKSTGDNMLSSLFLVVIKGFAVVIVITISGRLFLRPFFSIISDVKKDEIFVTTSLLIVLGASYFTTSLGLSSAMGAFIAGSLIAETEYRNRVEDSIMPFKGIFLAFFFLKVGMDIDIDFVVNNFHTVLLLSSIILVIKFAVILGLCRLFKFGWGASIHSGLILSQVGEFAFVLFEIIGSNKVVSKEMVELMCMVASFTMAITPLLVILGSKIEDRLDIQVDGDVNEEFSTVRDLNNHVIISGFGRVGRIVAYMLTQEKISYIAIDGNSQLVKKARAQGFPIYHGDITKEESLNRVAMKRASAVILGMSDKTSSNRAIKIIAQEYPSVRIITRVEDYRHAKRVRKLGADSAVPTTIETGLQLGGSLLHALYVPEHEVISIKEKIRRNDYEVIANADLFKGVGGFALQDDA